MVKVIWPDKVASDEVLSTVE